MSVERLGAFVSQWCFVALLAAATAAAIVVRRGHHALTAGRVPVGRVGPTRASLRRLSVAALLEALLGVAMITPPGRAWQTPVGPTPITTRLPTAGGASQIYSVAVVDRPAWLVRVLFDRPGRTVGIDTPAFTRFARHTSDDNPPEILGAAYRYAGRPVEVTGDGVDVYALGPHAHRLQVGDVIHTIGTDRVRTTNEYLAAILHATAPLTMTITRHDTAMTVTFASGEPIDAYTRARPGFGVNVGPDPTPIATTRAIGSSDGLPLALGVLTTLHAMPAPTRAVVATGIVTIDGRVTPIGAVDTKAHAAQRLHPCVFLVPTANLNTAHQAAPDVTIVGVDTLAAAVTAITTAHCS